MRLEELERAQVECEGASATLGRRSPAWVTYATLRTTWMALVGSLAVGSLVVGCGGHASESAACAHGGSDRDGMPDIGAYEL